MGVPGVLTSPRLSESTHRLADLPEQQAQAPLIIEDDTVEYFPCLDIAESIPCIDIADSEDEGSLTLFPEAHSAKAKKDIVHQDETLYRLNPKADLVQEIKAERIADAVKDPIWSESHRTVLEQPNPPPADRLLEVSPSNLPIPVSNRIPVSPAHDGHKTSLWFSRGRGSAKRNARTLARTHAYRERLYGRTKRVFRDFRQCSVQEPSPSSSPRYTSTEPFNTIEGPPLPAPLGHSSGITSLNNECIQQK